MNNQSFNIILIVAIGLFVATGFELHRREEEETTLPVEPDFPQTDGDGREMVSRELRKYFDRFEREAEKRGLLIDPYAFNIQASIEHTGRPNIAGTCFRHVSGYNPHLLIIERTKWNTYNDLRREMVVFHELGHCIADLPHSDGSDGNICHSIMNSGLSGCTVDYNSSTRASYLDDFFLNF